MFVEKNSFSPSSSKPERMNKKHIVKNILVLDAIFLLMDVAFNGLEAIQSSLHDEQGVGTTSQSVFYGIFALSSLFFAPLIIHLCGLKWTIVISLVPTLIWVAANGFGIWATMIPGASLLGLFGAPIWIAHSSYTMQLANEYAAQTNQSVNKIATFFFGIFNAFKMTGYVFGDIISGTVLRMGVTENSTRPNDEAVEDYCGMNDCPWAEINITTLDSPSDTVVWSLVGIYAVFGIFAIISGIVLLDPLPSYLQPEKGPLKEEVCGLLTSVIKLVKTKKMLFLIMMNVYAASYVVFIYADFSRSWITCALGIWMVGVFFLVYDGIAAFMCVISGWLTTKTGRPPLMLFSLIIGVVAMMVLVLWPINPNDSWIYFVVISCLSIQNSILEPVLMSLHGTAFPNQEQGSYGCYNFFWCIFGTIMYGYNYYVCTSIKAYLQFLFIFLGYLGYFLLERELRKTDDTNCTEDEKDKNAPNSVCNEG